MITTFVDTLTEVVPYTPNYFEDIALRNNALVTNCFPQFNTAIGEINTELNNINLMTNEVETNTSLTQLASLSAQGSANYQGLWTSKGYTLGQTVSDTNGLRWVCKLTHTTAQSPVEGTYWTIAVPYLGVIGNISSPLLDIPLKNSLVMKAGVGNVTFTRSSTATYINRFGLLKVALSNEPRFEKEGYLNEGSSTNLSLQSEDFSSAEWTKQFTTVSTNVTTTTDPYGTNLADKIVEDTTTNGHGFFDTYGGFTAGTAYTGSIFIKAAERSAIQMRLGSSAFGVTQQVDFDLTTQTVTVTAGTATGSIIPMDNGWYRCSISATATITASSTWVVYAMSGGAVIYTGDGTSGFYQFGGQLEAMPFATSYIPTTTATVTRAADSLYITAEGNFGLASSAKTIIIDWDILGHSTTTSQTLFDLPNGTTQYNRILSSVHAVSNRPVAFYSGTTRYFAASLVAPLTKTRIAMAIGGGATSTNTLYKDGIAYSTNTDTIALDGVPSIISIGRLYGSTANHYGHISNVRVYDKTLTAQEVALA